MDQNALKAEVGRIAAARVEDGMVLGLGSGSTAEAFLKSLGARVAEGLTVRGVPTSERTATLCRELGIELTDLERDPALDLAIDGADEIDPDFNLIKGGGGALLREKIVAAAAERMLVIADASKQVEHLGAFRLPVEITPFGAASTIRAVESICSQHGLNGDLTVRPNLATQDADRAPFVTDGGHWIIDCPSGAIDNPKALDEALRAVPGVMETGLFIAMADQALIAGKDAVETLELER
ncbi:MAG: ribose-5-phosphate isomerase RpiA [Pseudomonadota bacterium]